jgi:ubiquinol-cytochrome c reductase cytochrome b subunit
MRGDPIVSGATLSRFFAAHVIVLPWVALALLAFHFALVRRHGVAPPERPTPKQLGPGRPFYPNQLLRSFAVAALTTAILITLAVLAPRPIGDVANPEIPPAQLRSTWVVVDVSRALTHYLGAWGLALFALLGIGLALVPLLHRTPERSLRGRPRALGVGLLFFAVFLGAWAVGSRLETVPPAAADEAVDMTGAPADSATRDTTADTTGAARRSAPPATKDTTLGTGGKR